MAELYDRWTDPGSDVIQTRSFPAYPALVSRRVPEGVDEPYAEDFREASLCLTISPKASAALSRRLLQHILREKAGVKHSNLVAEIDEIRGRNVLPADLSDDLDSVRTVGNFAAHPIKDRETEAVTEVEEGEAEWLLDLLEELLDFYFVRPKIRAQRRDAMNAKLEAANKPPLAGTSEDEAPVENS
ncbi:MAG: DUF4145 domain-containing protein [Actinomycetota bacterium]|nr:DUF4145 domain-containing protein [Actinomycetota bacterium]